MRPDDLPEIPPGPPLLVVLSGPSGAGKDAVRELLIAWRLPFHFAVTATTRPPRPDEVEGVDYHFVSEAEFDRLEREGGLLEHAIVYGQRKGVPKAEVLTPLAAGKDVIARVDVQGAATLKRLVPEALLIFISLPVDEAQRRLTERATESEDQLKLRIETAEEEIEAARSFDHVVVNETGQLEATVRRILELIAAEKRRLAASNRQQATGNRD
jgi:guanylate kinase